MDVFVTLVWLYSVSAVSQDLGYIKAFLEQKDSYRKKYRPRYHISAPFGWLSDPAGFTYFKRRYHVFYQYHPYNGAWGPIHWGHAVSKNLVDWAHYPAALVPNNIYEKHGCLAGTALVYQRNLMLFYTGNVLSGNKTHQSQNVAISRNAIFFPKNRHNPIIRDQLFAKGIFKNPKVWRYRGTWLMLIGATSLDLYPILLLYTSIDAFSWDLNGTIAKSYGDMGSVWENPDVINVDGFDVLILSVHGIRTGGFRFRNHHQTGYIVGRFSYSTFRFEDFELSTATFNELDHGHDFYAPKSMIAPDGRRLLIGWLGMWESDMEEVSEGWASMATLVRELALDHRGRLLMKPVKEISNLRVELLENAWYSPGETFHAGTNYFELILNSTTTTSDVSLTFEWNGNEFKIRYSSDRRYMVVDRGGPDGVRQADWSPEEHVHWRIFVDSSSIEIFCGSGEVVFTSRIYPKKVMYVRVGGDTDVHITQYRLRRSVGYDERLREKLKNHYLSNYKNQK